MDFLNKLSSGLSYTQFLEQYATLEQKQRWDDFHASITLNDDQKLLLTSFVREMNVLVVAGTWCGDCVNQCPIFDHFASQTETIRLSFFDRDDHPDLLEAFPTCGGARVPTVLFVSEDGHLCGRYGDRTLSKYREMVASLAGAACPTGLAHEGSLTEQVVQEWLDEFERIQWMLRTSGRLRGLHGD